MRARRHRRVPSGNMRRLAGIFVAWLGLVSARPAAAQVETVSDDFQWWQSAAEVYEAASFEVYFGSNAPYVGSGCLFLSGGGPGPVRLDLTHGQMVLSLPGQDCPVYDGTSMDGVGADGWIPQGQVLILEFDPPIHGFYAPFGSLAADETVGLRLLGEQGLDQTLTSLPSTNGTFGRGFGFMSEQPVQRIEVSSSEAGTVLLGHFVGVTRETITRPGLQPCVSAPCDFAVAHALHRPLAFLTPATGTADLDSWALGPGFETGLAAGDAICAYWAEQAGYRLPNRFIALLGAGSSDGLCRAAGLTGAYGSLPSQCGGMPVHPSRGRWWRVDGQPWAAPFEGSGYPRRPLLDVAGDRTTELHFTGVLPNGSCGEWTDADNPSGTSVGNPNAVDLYWLDQGGTACNAQRRLLCVETALGLPFPDESAHGRPVFVTRATGPGDLRAWEEADPLASDGVAAADSVCAAEALAAGLPDPDAFRAWLSTSSADAIARLTHDGRYVRTDGVAVAASPADLVDGLVDTGIARHADGGEASSLNVWTGTLADGSFTGSSCGDWTIGENTAIAHTGSSGQADAGWTSFSSAACQNDLHLYCVSDAIHDPAVFADGFEAITP